MVENSLQLDLPADKRFLPATLLGEPFVFPLLNFQFAGGAVHGSVCGIAPIRFHLTLDDLRHPPYHISAQRGQVTRRDVNGSAALIILSLHQPDGDLIAKNIRTAQPLAKFRLQPVLLGLECDLNVTGRIHINEVLDLLRVGEAEILNLPEERQHMLPSLRPAQGTVPDFLFGGGGLEPDNGWWQTIRCRHIETPLQLFRWHRPVDDCPQDGLDLVPYRIALVVLPIDQVLTAGLQQMDGRNGIVVPAIPSIKDRQRIKLLTADFTDFADGRQTSDLPLLISDL